MIARGLGVVLLALGAGCVHVAPEARRTYLAPIASVPELSAAIASHRVLFGRWPRELGDLAKEESGAKVSPEHLARIRALEVEERGPDVARYTFIFGGGGSSTLEVRINPPGEQVPPRAPGPAPGR